MKKIIALLFPTLLLSACATTDQAPNWVEYFQNEGAVMFVDQNTKKASEGGAAAKASAILVNYTNIDAVGTQSATIALVVNCESREVKVGEFTAYNEKDAKGDVIRVDAATSDAFSPAVNYLSGEEMVTVICGK